MNCDLSRKKAISENWPWFCAFNRKGTCINPYPGLTVNRKVYEVVGLVAPVCCDLTPIPVTATDKELKPMMAGYIETAKMKHIAWPTIILATYETPRGEHNETVFATTTAKSKDPKDIIEALRDHGLGHELEAEDTEIYIIEASFSAKRAMKAAHLKLNRDYKLVDEDTPEEPEEPIDPGKLQVSTSTYSEERLKESEGLPSCFRDGSEMDD